MELDAGRALLEHGVLGALVVLQFGVILWLITKLTTKLNGATRRVARLEHYMLHSEDPNLNKTPRGEHGEGGE